MQIQLGSIRKRHLPVLALCGVLSAQAAAQPATTVVSEGLAARPSTHVALHNARIVVEPGRVIERGVVELRDGVIIAVNAGDQLPAGAEARDLQGKTVFAGFIELASDVGVPKSMRVGGIAAAAPGQPAHEQQANEPGARHWNRRVRPELSVAERLELDAAELKALRGLGFATALAVPTAGVLAGQSALISLGEPRRKNAQLLRSDVAQHVGFDFAYGSEYPGSLMGAIALVRQTFMDARWQDQTLKAAPVARIEANLALSALAASVNARQPVMFRLDDELDVARAAKLRTELGLSGMLLGTGFEYRVLGALSAAKMPVLVPLRFPEAPSIENTEAALALSLAELQHWEQAPTNPARVDAAKVRFALTASGLKDGGKAFWPNLRRAVAAGLAEDAALRALTIVPAELLNESARLGRVAKGQLANLVIADAALFSSDAAKLFEVWVEGQRFELAPVSITSVTGEWSLRWADGAGPASWKVSADGEVLTVDANGSGFMLKRDGDQLVGLPAASLFGGGEGLARIELRVRGTQISGHRALADGRLVGVTASIKALPAESKVPEPSAAVPAIPAFSGYPAGEYGRPLPTQADVLIRGATLWTNTDAGVIENGELWVRAGKIAGVGRDLKVPANIDVIDGRGLQLTPGLIDAHSHAAIARNVNEPSHSVTAEVRVADVLDPTDISIYRQLAGGVTSANLLHGSANAIGGQNAVIKLRWGADADGLVFADAPAGIKFALGENVKQANWGEGFTSRYPQTRQGVEQIIREHFNAARAYAESRRSDKTTRRDLRLEALAEILAAERYIHVHSYRSDELLMFVRLAQDYNLRGVTFQHVLEGYKVAPELASISAGASTFSDWWSYKPEAFDGTPYQAVLLEPQGVPVSFNSDSNELARRLNTEAAKAMKYGGMPAEDALKLVTLNPARQLRVDHRVGKLATGMDADFVLWNAPPMSSFARAEQTWIDGRRLFDRTEDARLQAAAYAERERLLAKIASERSTTLALGNPTETKEPVADAPTPDLQRHWRAFVAGRGLYGSGAELNSCELQGHGH